MGTLVPVYISIVFLTAFEGDVPPQYFQDGEERLQKLRESGGRQRRDVHSEMKYIELVLVADRAEVIMKSIFTGLLSRHGLQ